MYVCMYVCVYVCMRRQIVKSINENVNDRSDDNNDEFFIDVISVNCIENPMKCDEETNSNVLNKVTLYTSKSCIDDVSCNHNVKINFNSSSEWSHTLEIHEFKIDTGSQVNIIREEDYQKLIPKPELSKAGVTLSAYNNTTVPVHGKCVCYVPDGKSKMCMLCY